MTPITHPFHAQADDDAVCTCGKAKAHHAAINQEPTIQEVVDSGMTADRIRDVVDGIAKGIRYRLDAGRPPAEFERDVRTSLARIADALDYLVALDRQRK